MSSTWAWFAPGAVALGVGLVLSYLGRPRHRR